MNEQVRRGISRHGLDAAFQAKERQKSNLLLSAEMLREQGQVENAASHFAQAAAIEEELGDLCRRQGLLEKASVHQFSAASCWAQAGNFYQAIALLDNLLARTDLSERLRQRVQLYVQTLRARRAQWYMEIVATAAEG
jgi:tetratricopeptide (TPR) repeat protein